MASFSPTRMTVRIGGKKFFMNAELVSYTNNDREMNIKFDTDGMFEIKLDKRFRCKRRVR